MYYYSDLGENECASYIGIVVVKQKYTDHTLVYDGDKKRFQNGTIRPETTFQLEIPDLFLTVVLCSQKS